MKIECVQEKIKEVVGLAEKVAGKHMSLPVLSCVLIEASEKAITLKATNLDTGLELQIPGKVLEPGTVAIPASILNSFIGSLSGGDKAIVLETSDNNLKIQTPRSSGVIKTQAHDDFPSIPKVVDGSTFTLHAQDLLKGLKSVWYSSSVSSIKPELSSVYIYCDEEFMVFVATDSFRLAEKKVKMKTAKDFGQILIPFKNIPDIMRILEPINDDIEISLNKNQISFTYKGLYFTSRVVDGVFPDYKQIIPKASTTEVVALKQDLVNALKISNIFSDKFNQVSVHVIPKEKQMVITSKNNDIGEHTTKIQGNFTGEEVEVSFNYKYFIDCFQSISSDSLVLKFNQQNKPMIINGSSDTSFMYLVMPMNR